MCLLKDWERDSKSCCMGVKRVQDQSVTADHKLADSDLSNAADPQTKERHQKSDAIEVNS